MGEGVAVRPGVGEGVAARPGVGEGVAVRPGVGEGVGDHRITNAFPCFYSKLVPYIHTNSSADS